MASVEVYGLRSTGDGRIRYVGQTTKGSDRRLKKHLENAMGGVSTHLYNWMRHEINKGHQIACFVIEREAVWGETEKRIIAWYKRHGAVLVNQTDGGDGTLGWSPTDEQRQRMSSCMLGKKRPKHVQDKINKTIVANGGRRQSPECIEKIRVANTGKRLSKETIEKRTATRRANGGFVYTDEWREKQRISATAAWAKRKGGKYVEN